MFGQTFDWPDAAVVALLVVLEGVLSIDNAIVLGLLARRLPPRLQGRALTYGLVGAFAFRLLAIGLAAWLLQWRSVKLLGGAYLIYVAAKYFLYEMRRPDDGHPVASALAASAAQAGSASSRGGADELSADEQVEAQLQPPVASSANEASRLSTHAMRFWSTVAVIELTDIAFAVDSILAAIALVGPPPAYAASTAIHPKLWVIVTGGMLGVILMRIAAIAFIKLLDRFPRLEVAAYLLVMVIGLKLLSDWGVNSPAHPHRINFHTPSDPAFWIFWSLMLVSLAIGFLPQRRPNTA